MSQALFENWDVTKDALTDGLEGNKKAVMESTLENTKQYLQEAAASGSTMAGNIATLNKVILPVIRRVMPTVIANELVGVQPMTGPVGQIHTLRVRYSQTAGGVNAGDEALSPFAIAKGYSGDATAGTATTATRIPAVSARRTMALTGRSCFVTRQFDLTRFYFTNKSSSSDPGADMLFHSFLPYERYILMPR